MAFSNDNVSVVVPVSMMAIYLTLTALVAVPAEEVFTVLTFFSICGILYIILGSLAAEAMRSLMKS
jgi:hypothetical protein